MITETALHIFIICLSIVVSLISIAALYYAVYRLLVLYKHPETFDFGLSKIRMLEKRINELEEQLDDEVRKTSYYKNKYEQEHEQYLIVLNSRNNLTKENVGLRQQIALKQITFK